MGHPIKSFLRFKVDNLREMVWVYVWLKFFIFWVRKCAIRAKRKRPVLVNSRVTCPKRKGKNKKKKWRMEAEEMTFLSTKCGAACLKSWSQSQATIRLLWNQKVYCLRLDPVFSHINPVHNLPHHFSDVHFNIMYELVFQAVSRFRFSKQNIVSISHMYHVIYMSSQILYLIMLIISGEVF